MLAARSASAAALAVALALAVSSCGDAGGGGEPGASPAVAVPAGAPVYVEALVGPEGDRREEIVGALERLLATDEPGAELIELIEGAFDEAEVSYAEDIEPWLGERAGLFLTGFEEGEDSNGAFVVETTDAEAALEAARANIEQRLDRGEEVEEASEGEVELIAGDGDAAAVVGDFLVAGSESGTRAAVKAHDGDSLAESDRFAGEFEEQRADSVIALTADVAAALDAAVESGAISAEDREKLGVPAMLGFDPGEPIVAGLDVGPDLLNLDFSVTPTEGFASEASPLLEELPGDAWFALAVADAGEGLGKALDALGSQLEGVPGAPPGGIDAFLKREIGIDLSADVVPWLGDVAAFMRGTSPLEIGGAVLAETSDEAATGAALDDLRAALEDRPEIEVSDLRIEGEGFTIAPAEAPVFFPIFQRGGRFVAALGEEAAEDVLAPESRLGDSEAFQAAREALGENIEPGLFLDFEPLFSFIEVIPDIADDADFQAAQPYLDALDYVAAGQRAADGRLEGRVVLGLREASDSGESE